MRRKRERKVIHSGSRRQPDVSYTPRVLRQGGPVVLKAEAKGLVHRTGTGGRPGRSAYSAGSGRGLPGAGGRLRAAAASGACPADAGRRRRGAHRRGAGTRIRAAGGVRARRRGHRGARRSRRPADPAGRRRRRRDDQFGARRAAASRPPGHTAALADALLRVSRLADDLPEVSELDLNPVLARPDGAWCVDVRVRMSPAEPRDPSCAGCSEHAAAHRQPAVRTAGYTGSQPRCRAVLVLAAALSGLRPGQAPRDYRRDVPPGTRRSRRWPRRAHDARERKQA